MSKTGNIVFGLCAAAGAAVVGVMVYGKLTQKPSTPTPTPPEKRIVSISVVPKDISMQAGQAHQYMAVGTLSDGSTFDITNQVAWTTTKPAIAAVSSTGLVTAVGAGTCQVVAAVSQELYGYTTLTVTEEPGLVSISVVPKNISMQAGQAHQYMAVRTLSDGSTSDVTGRVGWATTDPTIATVSSAGLVTAVGAGTCQVVAAVTQELYGYATLTVISVAAQPTVTGVSPNAGQQGQTLNVTITGTNLTGAIGVDFGAGITVSSFTIDSPTQITATIIIATDSGLGPGDVEVAFPAGTGVLARGFTVNAFVPVLEKFEHFNDNDAAGMPQSQYRVNQANQVGQTFTPKITHYMTRLWAKAGGGSSWPDSIYLWIYTTKPDGTPKETLSTNKFRTDSLTGSAGWVKYDLQTPVLLQAGVRYAFVFQHFQETFGLMRQLGVYLASRPDGADPYPGNAWFQGLGQTWEVLPSSVMLFDEWGYRV